MTERPDSSSLEVPEPAPAEVLLPEDQESVPPPTADGPAPGPVFGGFWIRFAAYIIDGLILFVAGLFVGVLGGLLAGEMAWSSREQQVFSSLLGLVLSAGYFAYFWVHGGSTPGMNLIGLQVVRDADGGPITWGKALLRYVGVVISILVVFIGLIWVAFDSRKRGWHDLIAGTVVIRRPDVEISGGRKVLVIGAIGCGVLLPFLATVSIVALLFMGPMIQDIFQKVGDDLSRGPDGAIVEPVEIRYTSLRVGDCFELVDPDVPSIETVMAVPCAEEHIYEVFFIGDMPDGDYPDEAVISAFLDEQCLPAFEEFVGLAFEESVLGIIPVGPSEDDWAAGDRRVTCQLHNAQTPVSGSARGSAE